MPGAGDMVDERQRAIVRRATQADVEGIVALVLDVQRLHVGHEPEVFREPTAAEVEVWLRARLDDGWRGTVALLDGAVVGYALVELVQRDDGVFTRGAHVAHLHQIGVAAEHRGSGLGRAVLDAACADAAAAGASRVGLETWGFNAHAQAFFTANGFEPSNVRFRRAL